MRRRLIQFIICFRSYILNLFKYNLFRYTNKLIYTSDKFIYTLVISFGVKPKLVFIKYCSIVELRDVIYCLF